MKKLTAPRMDRCIGCHSCSLACARLVHGLHAWGSGGIRIYSSGGLTTGFVADICVACEDAPCVKVCPTVALSQRKGGGVRVNHKWCMRCGECAKVCPVQGIQVDPSSRLPFVCIHCGRCVAFCPNGCLELAEIPETTGKKNNAAVAGSTAE